MPLKQGNVLSWASEIEDEAMAQAERAARMPFVKGHLALMPDAHWGKGAAIGSVIPTRGAIIPAAVGVDIGCGMIAVETSLNASHLPDDLGPLHGLIREAVPAGVGNGHEDHSIMPREWEALVLDTGYELLDDKQIEKAYKQFGSLGSGNHFVEVCLDERDVVWVVLHSGSRGIGNQLAKIHIDGAKALMKRYFIELEDPDLAYLVEGTYEFDAYITSMLWAQRYAMGNREVMMDAVLHAVAKACGQEGNVDHTVFTNGATGVTTPVQRQRINCHHNYTERENHLGTNVWLTRKGAIRARVGDKGVIPGSMGTSSYIVSGLGNPASYDSCSHGAGRRMGRKQAARTLDVAGLREQMKGKAWNDRDAEALIDEDPRAYKDVKQVMADQKDLVEIEHTLHQVLNFKGC